MTSLREALTDAVVYAMGLVGDLPADLAQFKTVGHYSQSLRRNVRELYGNQITEAQFVDRLLVLVDEQLTKAWNEGMRSNGLDPKRDMIEEWQVILDNAKLKELDYVDDFAAEIVQAAADDEANQTNTMGTYTARADIWANRYADIVNLSIVTTAPGKYKLMWMLGRTEDHCTTCNALNGIVAFAAEWDLAKVRPQNPPNQDLECGGWRCDCRLIPTTARRTRGAWDRIMRIVKR